MHYYSTLYSTTYYTELFHWTAKLSLFYTFSLKECAIIEFCWANTENSIYTKGRTI